MAPFIDNVLIRVGVSIGSACIPYCKKHKLIILDKHTLTPLLVLYFHEIGFLSGREKERERAYFKSHKRIISYCKHMTVRPKQPYMTSFPVERLSSFSSPYLYF